MKGDEVIFSEVSPRPHDTGMVTMVSQNMSEFELHVRAITGLPIPEIVVRPGASVAVLSSIVGLVVCLMGSTGTCRLLGLSFLA